MKRLLPLVYVSSLLFLSLTCQHTNSPDPVPTDPDPISNVPFFRQENTQFRGSQVNCLLTRWRQGQVGKDTITLGVINDQATYQAFFPCSLSTPLPAIDFNTYTLLIGFVSGTAAPVSNISGIEQNLVPTPSGQYDYQVTVTGKTKAGGEWFGFCGLAAKISDPTLVRLKMTYLVR